MDTRVLSKMQQQKKLPSIKGLKNVLAQPYEKYWPVLVEDKESCLEESLNRLLPGLKRQSNAIPWSQLRKMEKEERLAARKKAQMETQANSSENIILKAITLGVNAVTRDLEKGNLACVLLDSNVESLLVKHVVVMAHNKGIPILLVPFLKKVTLENIGFASAAMGLKSVGTEVGNPFHEVLQEVVRCSPPDPSAQKVLLNESTKVTVQDSTKEEKMSIEEENALTEKCFTLSTNVYKYRSTRKERAFVPPSTAEKVEIDKEWSEFIPIGDYDTEIDMGKVLIPRKKQRYMDIHATVDKDQRMKSDGYIAYSSKNDELPPQGANKLVNNKNTAYLPLKVKRVQGNPQRLKATKPPKQKKKSSSNKG